MRYIGVISSSEIGSDGDPTSIQHIPLVGNTVEVIIPHGATGTNGWLSGFFQNLSPTFPIFLNFYNSGKEIQEIRIPPLHEIKIKNQNCERLLILTKVNDGNVRRYGVFRYSFDVVVSESDLESSELLYLVSVKLKALDPQKAYYGLIENQVFPVTIGTDLDIFIPFNRQMIIITLKHEYDSRGTKLKDTDPIVIESGFESNDMVPTFLPVNISYLTVHRPFSKVEIDIFSSILVGNIENPLADNSKFKVKSSTTLPGVNKFDEVMEFAFI